ncbi:hypothetical protein ACTMS0_12245 [Micromonospora sp. H33]|uniref:hypothetical protein n=1 Tax=Micromonospora sp. H33 TaxID=3452215 RepID=UPI003F8BB03D
MGRSRRRRASGPAVEPGPAAAATDERLSLLESRIAELQRDTRRRASWYREPSVLVAILALVLSLVSVYLTYRQGVEQKSQESRAELGQLIQRISDLSRDSVAKAEDEEGQAVVRQPPARVDNERVALAQQAADIIRRMPDEVSAHECYLVAQAFYESKRFAESREIARIGTSKRVDGITHPALYRVEAGSSFADGYLEEGRRAMRGAIDSSPSAPEEERVYNRAYNEVFWADWERKARACTEAHQHFENAKRLTEQLTSETYRAQMGKLVAEPEPACP